VVATEDGAALPTSTGDDGGSIVKVVLRNGRVLRLWDRMAAGRAALLADALEGWCSEASCHSSGCKSRRHRSPIDVVVISSGGKGDRPVESLDVKASGGRDVFRSDPSGGGEQPDRPQQL
jgi:hypothetical protein